MMKIKLILFSVFVVLLLVVTACENGGYDIIDSDDEDSVAEKTFCENAGGEWKDFPTPCNLDDLGNARGDSKPDACIQVITPSCDCGPEKYWDEINCLPNPIN